MADSVSLDGVVLGGVSFGGMVASVMARHGRPRALVLIASSSTGRVVGGFRRPLARMMSSVPPWPPPRPLWPLLAWAFGASEREHKRVLHGLIARAHMPFVQWGLSAILGWSPPSPPGTPVFHIHGTADRLVPLRRVRPTEVVPGGGHLINVTHAEQVNAFVRRVLASPSPADGRPRI
jgi:pimeloyl-ACP methyl ester carboxylesterase